MENCPDSDNPEGAAEDVAPEETPQEPATPEHPFVPAELARFDFDQISEESVSTTDVIDFSGEENEYLSGDLKQHALAFAILSSLIGFIFSAWLFLGERAGPATELLDRRRAEGRAVRVARSETGSYSSLGGFFRAPRVKKKERMAPRTREWKDLTALESVKVDPSTEPPEKKKKKKVLAASVVDRPDYLTATRRTTSRPGPARSDGGSLSRLLYPRVGERPDRSSLSSVEASVKSSLIVVRGPGGKDTLGVVLDSTGKALVSNLVAGQATQVWTDGGRLNANLLARDPEYGVALIQIEGGFFRDLPLAPSPPARGETLLAFGPGSGGALSAWCDAGPSFGGAGFLMEGYLGRNTWGSPIFNDRGELTGVHFSSLAGIPGSGVHLACDSAAIYRLLRGYQGGGSYNSTETQALRALAGVAQAQGETRRSRVVAGTGISEFGIGMSRDEISRWVSSPRKSYPGAGRELWVSEAPPVELLFIDDRLVAGYTSFTGFSTPGGLSVGLPVDNSVLSRQFDHYKLYSPLAVTPGLDLILGGGRITGFVVRPNMTGKS